MSDLRAATTAGPLTMSPAEASELFDQLSPCPLDTLRGRWSGREIHTGHPLDGALANVSWYGKRFDGPAAVHPLMVTDASGAAFPLNPALLPMRTITSPLPLPEFVASIAPRVMSIARRAVRARRYGADLAAIAHRGCTTASMVYRDKPIVDIFRLADADTVVGTMEYTGMPRPHFFVLHRDRIR